MANLLFFNVERGHRRPRKFRLSNNSLIDDYTDEELRARYRFDRQSILYITNLLARDLRRSTARNHALTPLHQILIALRFFASGSLLQVIGDTVGVDKSTVSRAVYFSANSFFAEEWRFFHFSLTSFKERFSVPTAFTAAAILLQSSFFFWLVILFVSLLCKIAKFSSTFSVSVAISVGVKFCFLAFLRGASAKTTISGEAISLSKQTKSIMGCYPRVSRV